MNDLWAVVSFLLWLAVTVGYAALCHRFVRECRAELDRARCYVEDTYDDIEDLLAGQDRPGRHRLQDR